MNDAPAATELARLAQSYYDAIGDLPYTDSSLGPAADLERRIALSALGTLEAAGRLKAMKRDPKSGSIPRSVGREIDRLISLIDGQFRRWGWSSLLGPDGEARIRAGLEGHKAKWVEFLRCALAWRSMPDVGPHKKADGAADEAESLGLTPLALPPGTTPEEAEQRAWGLYRDWKESPSLGQYLPTSPPPDERMAIAQASDELARYAARFAECQEDEPRAAVTKPNVEPIPDQGAAQRSVGESPEPDEEPPEEKHRRVREYLIRKPTATSAQIAQALNLREQTVRRMPSWKERPRKRPPKSGSTSVKPRPLTEEILAARKGTDADPATIVADADEAMRNAEARLLNTLSQEERGLYHGLSPEKKQERIADFLLNA